MKTMKVTILSFMVLVVSGLSAQKENKNELTKEERIKERQEKLALKLELTEEEKSAFFELREEYKKENKELRDRFKETREQAKKVDDMEDEEVEELMEKMFEFQQAKLDLKKRYHSMYKEILPAKKLAKLYHLEKKGKRDAANRKKMHQKQFRPAER